MWCHPRNKQTDQWHRVKGPESNSCICGNLVNKKVEPQNNGGMDRFFNKQGLRKFLDIKKK